MEVSGDLAGAQMLYQKMLTLSKSRGATVQNPGIVGMLAEAQTSFDAITKKIGPPPAPLASAVPPAPGEVSSPAPVEPSTAPSIIPKESPTSVPAPSTPESTVPGPGPSPSPRQPKSPMMGSIGSPPTAISCCNFRQTLRRWSSRSSLWLRWQSCSHCFRSSAITVRH